MSKIYELAEQAAEHAVVNPSEMNLESELDDVKVVIPKEFIDKFAELIVKECIDCLKPLSRNHSMVGAAQDTIKEHFGVEE